MNQSQIREFNIRKVLDVCQDLFLENGVENTTITSIAQKSGLTPTSIYRYFDNKYNLALTVWHDSLMEFYNENYMPAYAKASKNLETGLEKFKACMDVYYELYKGNPEWLEYTREMFSLASRETKNDYVKDPRKFWAEFFEEIPAPTLNALQEGVEDGSIRADVNIYSVYQLVTNIFTGIRTYEIFTPGMTALEIIRFTSDIIAAYLSDNT